MPSKTIIGLGVLCAGLALGAGYSLHLLSVQQDLTAAESEARAKAESLVKDLQARLAAATQRYSTISERAPSGQAADTDYSTGLRTEPRPDSPRERFGPRERGAGGMPGMMRTPGVNPDLVKALNLSEADAAKLAKIFEERQAKLRQLAEQSRGPFDPKAAEAIQEQADKEAHELLGDAKYEQYQDYRKDMQEHMRVSQLGQHLTDAGQAPLSEAQQEQLFAVLKQEKGTVPVPLQSNFGTRAEFGAAMTDWRNAYDQRVQDRAAGLLTPEQLGAFKDLRRPPSPPRPPR